MTDDGNGDLLTVDGPLSGTADTTRYRYNSAREVVGVVSRSDQAKAKRFQPAASSLR